VAHFFFSLGSSMDSRSLNPLWQFFVNLRHHQQPISLPSCRPFPRAQCRNRNAVPPLPFSVPPTAPRVLPDTGVSCFVAQVQVSLFFPRMKYTRSFGSPLVFAGESPEWGLRPVSFRRNNGLPAESGFLCERPIPLCQSHLSPFPLLADFRWWATGHSLAPVKIPSLFPLCIPPKPDFWPPPSLRCAGRS